MQYNFNFEKEYNGRNLFNAGHKIFQKIKFNSLSTNYKESKKLKDIFQTLLKLDQEFFSKLRNIITKSYFDYIGNMTQNLNNLIFKKGGSNPILLDK